MMKMVPEGGGDTTMSIALVFVVLCGAHAAASILTGC